MIKLTLYNRRSKQKCENEQLQWKGKKIIIQIQQIILKLKIEQEVPALIQSKSPHINLKILPNNLKLTKTMNKSLHFETLYNLELKKQLYDSLFSPDTFSTREICRSCYLPSNIEVNIPPWFWNDTYVSNKKCISFIFKVAKMQIKKESWFIK